MKNPGIAPGLSGKPSILFSKVAVRNTWVGAHAPMNNTGLSDEAWLPCAS
jgi:hypothetical protein